MTNTATFMPVVDALNTMRIFADVPDASFRPVNPFQEMFLNQVFQPHLAKRLQFSTEELKSIASKDNKTINEWLKSFGFDIELKPFVDPADFGVASILDVKVKWLKPGIEEVIAFGKCAEPQHKAFFMDVDDCVVTDYDGYDYPLVSIPCENKDTVFFTIADKERSGLDLLRWASGFREQYKNPRPSKNFNCLLCPKIDYEEKFELSDFIGMLLATPNGFGKIAEAKQQTKLKIDKFGAEAKSAVAMSLIFECCRFEPVKLPFILDQPFVMWMVRGNDPMPYFAAHITEDSLVAI